MRTEGLLIRFRLEGEEARALRELSRKELRHPRHQVRLIVRQELARRGLLKLKEDPAPIAPDEASLAELGEVAK